MAELVYAHGLGPCSFIGLWVRVPPRAPNNMYEVYILKSLMDQRTYTGHSKDAQERLQKHNSGKVNVTKNRRPLEIIYTERVFLLKEAKRRERYWKSGGGKRRVKSYFDEGPRPLKMGEARSSKT